MSHFTHSTPLISGATVRAAPLNSIFDGIQAGFELLPDAELSESGFASTVFIQDPITQDHAVNLRTLQNFPTFDVAVVDLGANRFSNMLDPVEDQDAATKIWVINQSGVVPAAEAARDAAQLAELGAASSETNAAISEANALASENSSISNAESSLTSETNAAAWANNAEDVLVDATQYSAFHWAKKAEAFAGGAIEIADVVGLQGELDSRASLSGAAFTGAITTSSTFAGRDVALDGSKLDLISDNANNFVHSINDVTDLTLSGGEVMSQLLTSSEGHVIGMAKRTLAPADIGAQASGIYNTSIGTDTPILGGGASIINSLTLSQGVISAFGYRNLLASDLGALGVADTAANSSLFLGLGLSASGNRWDVIPSISNAGALEGGMFYDFHGTDGNTGDYSWRMGLTTTGVNPGINFRNSSGVIRYQFQDGGDFHADGDLYANSTSVGSDPKLKKNIKSITNALNKIMGLSGKTFDWKKTGKSDAGLMSTDVRVALPEAVNVRQSMSSDDTYDSVNYNAIIGLVVEAIKELRVEKNNEIEKLKFELGLI